MRIKLDENLPGRLVSILTQLGHDVDTASHEVPAGSSDPELWRATQAAGRFLITQDLDLSDIRRYPPGSHCGVLVVRLRFPSRTALLSRLQSVFECEDVESWAGALVIATERKIRVRRVPSSS